MPAAHRPPLLLILAGLGACALMVAAGAGLGIFSGEPARATAPADPSALAHRMLRALAEVDHRAFVAPAGGHLKQLPEDAFLRLVLQHGARLRQGYELQALDTKTRRDVEMTRWRVVFASGGRDATLAIGTSGGTVRVFTLW